MIMTFWSVDCDSFEERFDGFMEKVIVVRGYLPYLDEFCYRYNNRNNDSMFSEIITKGLGVI